VAPARPPPWGERAAGGRRGGQFQIGGAPPPRYKLALVHSNYFELYRMKADRYWLRQKLVAHARAHGIKATVRTFGCSRNTVRKWLRRYRPGTPRTLVAQSTRPRHCPHQVPASVEGVVVRLRRQTGFGAERLKIEFQIGCGVSAIRRILRTHGLVRPRKKKHHTKRSLRAVKAQWRLFQQLVADTKYLQDIPYYWPQMQRLKLPRFQYTVREPVSGLCLTGYADERSKSYAVLLAERVSAHLAWHGVDLRQVEWQTDNGSEFLEDAGQRGLPSTVRALGSGHHYIPPKAHTWQSDVETVHRLEEDEFFDREDFRSPPEFWAKITTYWRYFNLARPNRYKEWQTPLQILRQRDPKLNLAVAAWRPLDLGSILGQYFRRYPAKGGHDLPTYP
jgi:transposase